MNGSTPTGPRSIWPHSEQGHLVSNRSWASATLRLHFATMMLLLKLLLAVTTGFLLLALL